MSTSAAAGAGLALWGAAAVFALGTVRGVGLPRGVAADKEHSKVTDYRGLLSTRLLAGGTAMAASRVGVGFVTFLMAFLLRGQGEGDRGFAIVIATAGVGGFVGSVLAPVVRGVGRESMLLLASLAVVMGAALWAAESFDLVRAAVVAGVVAAASGAGRLAFDNLLQGDAPPTVRGRAFARYETIFQLCWVGGAGLATAVRFGSRGACAPLLSLPQADSSWLCAACYGVDPRPATMAPTDAPRQGEGQRVPTPLVLVGHVATPRKA